MQLNKTISNSGWISGKVNAFRRVCHGSLGKGSLTTECSQSGMTVNRTECAHLFLHITLSLFPALSLLPRSLFFSQPLPLTQHTPNVICHPSVILYCCFPRGQNLRWRFPCKDSTGVASPTDYLIAVLPSVVPYYNACVALRMGWSRWSTAHW